MSLRVIQSNRIEKLLEELLNFLSENPLNSPFQQETILVQINGMAQWLKVQIALHQGIAANINFPMPASYIWELYQSHTKEIPDYLPFSKQATTWKLMAVLPSCLDENDFAPIREYLAVDDKSLRLFQLCQKIADVYDKYLVYRPEWIKEWERGEDESSAAAPWQAVLWRKLQTYATELGQPLLHRANINLGSALAASASLPSRISLFGISVLSPQQINFLRTVSHHTDVYVYQFNPCQHYWGDIVSEKVQAKYIVEAASKTALPEDTHITVGNPLLASMGQLGRDTIDLLLDTPEAEIHDCFSDIEPLNALSAIQADIMELTTGGVMKLSPSDPEGEITIDASDVSLQIHSCHSPLREVEVLHDQLLQRFEEDTTLTPRDVIVMVPDITTYTPAIHAVFSKSDIPYTLSDANTLETSPILQSISQILNLKTSRYTASEVIDLFSVPAVQRKFGLTELDVQQIIRIVNEASIRWGRFNQVNDEDQNTWEFGIRRMLLGYAMSSEQGLFNDILPLDNVQPELLSAIISMLDVLDRYQNAFEKTRTINSWKGVIESIMTELFAPDASEEIDLQIVRDALHQATVDAAENNVTEAYDITIIKEVISEAINQPKLSYGFYSGSVNFCTLIPMRSVPFKVVCLIGMNDGAYPRVVPSISFDLMTKSSRQKGDRSRRLDDRYLFLEAILSARNNVHISYIGKSIRDNKPLEPSSLVAELVTYCEQIFRLEDNSSTRKWLITEHPLQPFSKVYFTNTNTKLFSYSETWKKMAESLSSAIEKPFLDSKMSVKEVNTAKDTFTKDISLQELVTFYKNPTKYFFENTLHVHYDGVSELVSNEEPFSIDSLDLYLAKNDAIELFIDNKETASWTAEQLATGNLPSGQIGTHLLSNCLEEVSLFYKTISPYLDGQAVAYSNTLTFNSFSSDSSDEVSITGTVHNIYESGHIQYRLAKLKAIDQLQLWITHLFLCASEQMLTSTLFTEDSVVYLEPFDAGLARNELEQILKVFMSGKTEIVPFIPEMSFAFANSYLEHEDPEHAQQRAEMTWFNGDASRGNKSPPPSNNPYYSRAFECPEDFGRPFTDISMMLLMPLITNRWAPTYLQFEKEQKKRVGE
jgi:exodeoxyribonuclease V gamma subunit